MYADGACKEFLQCFPLFGFREDEVCYPYLGPLTQIFQNKELPVMHCLMEF